MRMPALVLTVMAATLLIAPANPQNGVNRTRKEQKEDSAKKIKELQKERIATLKKMAEQMLNLYKTSRVSYDEVFEARLLVLTAELEAAEKGSDRIKLYKNMVDALKAYEKFVESRVRFPRARNNPREGSPMSALLKVKARRLEAEINLERAKMKNP